MTIYLISPTVDSMKSLFVISPKSVRWLNAILGYVILALFFVGVGLLLYYQLSYILMTNPTMPFFEPDNYEYYLFAQRAIQLSTLNTSISNPFLIGVGPGFFEHPGLLQMPLVLYTITRLPLVWDFRILQGLAILAIYVFSLLFAKKVLDRLPVGRIYRYLAYTLIVTGFLLMQYTQITEWRGSEFIAALGLIILYLVSYLFTAKKLTYLTITAISTIAFLLSAAAWIWSGGWFLSIVEGSVIGGMLLYKFVLKKHPLIWKYIVAGLVIYSILLYIFYAQIEAAFSQIPLVGTYSCTYNPLQIGEVECLNPGNGLLAVLMMLVFGCFAIMAFLGKTIMSMEKGGYEYYLFGAGITALLTLPVAMIYLRLLSLIAPYFTILYALGVVAMLSYFTKTGTNRIVLSLTIVLILMSSFVGQYLFYSANTVLYRLANPSSLQGVAAYLLNFTAPTVFAYYGYGGYLEEYAHARVYADTVQGLGYAKIEAMDSVFMAPPQKACGLLDNFSPNPEFILIGGSMNQSVLLANASSGSLAAAPLEFNGSCGYTLAYSGKGFYLFRGAPERAPR